MWKRKLTSTVLITTSTVLLTNYAVQAQNYDDVIVFSDSLSDIGNAFNAFVATNQTPVPPSPPYFEGRFSNGLVWTENLALNLGITPNLNNNYAFGGSQTGISNLYEPMRFGVDSVITVPGLLGQVNNYATGGNIPEDNDLFVVWIGSNDYLVSDLTSPDEVANTLNTVITNTNTAVATLNSLGAKNIAVANLPNFANIPRVIGIGDPNLSNALTNLTITHNQFLESSLSDLELALGDSLNLEIIDMFALFEDITSNPDDFALTNVTEGCLLSASCDTSNINQFFFWDDIHPTARGHEIIADFALQSIPDNSSPSTTPESSSLGALFLLGLIGLGGKLKSRAKNVN